MAYWLHRVKHTCGTNVTVYTDQEDGFDVVSFFLPGQVKGNGKIPPGAVRGTLINEDESEKRPLYNGAEFYYGYGSE